MVFKELIMEKEVSFEELTVYPRLKGKTVLITGASSGIGYSCARYFARSGCNLVLGARRTDRLEDLKKQILKESKDSIKIHLDALDVTLTESVTKFTAGIPSGTEIDILVNNAGLALGKCDVQDTSDDYLDRMLDTNVKGVVKMIRAIVPGMIKRNKGHIINISSVAGIESYKGGSVYCGSKHAVQAINKALLKELTPYPGIRVCSICPGLVETEFGLVRFEGQESKAKEAYKGMQPLLGDDIADTILFVASRPDHVQIADMLIFPTNQGSSEVVHRN